MLPLLSFTNKIWDPISLEGVAIIAAQHILDSVLEMFNNFKTRGLDPKNAFLIGKCYSSSRDVFKDFRKSGFQISKNSFYFDSHRPFDDFYKEIVQEFLEESLQKIDFKKVRKLIIIDDGGYLIRCLSSYHFEEPIPIVCIEQTSSGFHLLSNQNIVFPIINVARSSAKLILETPYIIESCLNRLFAHIPRKNLQGNNILVLGKGIVGQAVAQALADEAKVTIFDPKTESKDALTTELMQSNFLFGCSGFKSLAFQNYRLLKPGSILASFSSSDREFDAHAFRSLFPKTTRRHKNYKKNGVTLLQSGFPINFWGTRMNMPMSHIQITIALLTGAVFQGLSTKSLPNGFQSSDEEFERLIVQESQRITAPKLSRRPILINLKEKHKRMVS